ncbi:DUF6355 family natural product biosynthesis protein [Kribbella sp. DT2]|uniref:DUF6355 family natural product biosynthesis protein n=1 Tax=Kribbella sp. DT2 TaxID=3393427 RepID=UPI003CEB72A7
MKSLRASALLLPVALGAAGLAVSATPAQAGVPCGQYHTTSRLLYNHCGDHSVVVYVRNAYGFGEDLCLHPGQHDVGEWGVGVNQRNDAWSNGTRCSSGGW